MNFRETTFSDASRSANDDLQVDDLDSNSNWVQHPLPEMDNRKIPENTNCVNNVDAFVSCGGVVPRKSERVRKSKVIFDTSDESTSYSSTQRKVTNVNSHRTGGRGRQSLGRSFCCDLCKSPYVNPKQRTDKKTKKKTSLHNTVDPVTKKLLNLCNVCGMSVNYVPQPGKTRTAVVLSSDDKDKYLEEAKLFATFMSEALNDQDATQLYCPYFKIKGCGCVQRFIKADGELVDEWKKRALLLLQLLKKAKDLSKQKSYAMDPNKCVSSGNVKYRRACSIGLGNGQKKSRGFEEFVLRNRQYLKEQLHLCERATQYVLFYSNNFLHKRLKTEPDRGARIIRKKGKAALGLLVRIADLPKQHCCVEKCVTLAVTHGHLLSQWRDRAISGQTEARWVLAEMLTPCSGTNANCWRFISLVTGCSRSTILNVAEQMKVTGGNREPPEHGLKRWWQDHPRSKLILDNVEAHEEEESNPSLWSPQPYDGVESGQEQEKLTSPISKPITVSDTALQLRVLQLQRQVAQQESTIQQQQQLIEHFLKPPIVQVKHSSLPISTSSVQDVERDNPEYANPISPDVNISIFQRAVTDNESADDQAVIRSSCFSGFYLIDRPGISS